MILTQETTITTPEKISTDLTIVVRRPTAMLLRRPLPSGGKFTAGLKILDHLHVSCQNI
ncbi:hypothetical protein OESDEN_24257 [Oesophagostomum dentatum]|uniref:Uncharacterized protein n=1 Tax=Oesophagostomum dentatum TaxID=61180 RepID=A0A0B1RTZ1_OESDE|nr:hypothetical protein OESDEN_24257 [Oesophagostomum dentatum]